MAFGGGLGWTHAGAFSSIAVRLPAGRWLTSWRTLPSYERSAVAHDRHEAPSMTDPELDAWIDAGTALLGIPIQPEWRAAIRLHLTITFGHAITVLAFGLPDEADPAPTFHA
jgi:hypothetical protein